MRWITTAGLAGCLWLTGVSLGQDAEQDDQLQRWVDYYAQRAAEYEFTSAEGERLPFELHPQPLLTYTNPVRRRDQHGALFAWTHDGRPQMLASLWSIARTNDANVRRVAHEVHSLASIPISVECPASSDPTAIRSAAISWRLEPAAEGDAFGIEWSRPPGLARPLRLIQMRRIAEDLTAVSIDRGDGSPRPLRLMSTPLMRYESKTAGVIDGCLFAYALATDPELVIVVEAVRGPLGEGVGHWRVLPARLTGTELRLSHGEEELWRCDKIDYRSQTGPYRLQIGVSELPSERKGVRPQ